MQKCQICQFSPRNPYGGEDRIMQAMYGDAYKCKTACNPVTCRNMDCNALVHRECMWEYFQHNKDSFKCVCKKGKYYSRDLRMLVQEEKRELERMQEQAEAEEYGRLEENARDQWKTQYIGQTFKIDDDGNFFWGTVSNCVTTTFTEAQEVEWLISFADTRWLHVPHCLLGDGTVAIKVKDCEEVQVDEGTRATPCENPDCPNELQCYGRFCSTQCRRQSTEEEQMREQNTEEEQEAADEISIEPKHFKTPEEVIAAVVGEWEEHHASRVHEVEDEVQDGEQWKSFLKKDAKERAKGLPADEYDGEVWEILGEVREEAGNTCTCPDSSQKPARELRHASVKVGSLMEDHPDLEPEKVKEKQAQFEREKAKKYCLYDIIITVLIKLFLPMAYLKTMAEQVNKNVNLQHKRYEEAYKVKHVDEDGKWLNLQEDDAGKKYQRSKNYQLQPLLPRKNIHVLPKGVNSMNELHQPPLPCDL